MYLSGGVPPDFPGWEPESLTQKHIWRVIECASVSNWEQIDSSESRVCWESTLILFLDARQKLPMMWGAQLSKCEGVYSILFLLDQTVCLAVAVTRPVGMYASEVSRIPQDCGGCSAKWTYECSILVYTNVTQTNSVRSFGGWGSSTNFRRPVGWNGRSALVVQCQKCHILAHDFWVCIFQSSTPTNSSFSAPWSS